MMDEYAQAALKRIDQWEGDAGAINVRLAVKVELETMFMAGQLDVIKRIHNEWYTYSTVPMPVWLETVLDLMTP